MCALLRKVEEINNFRDLMREGYEDLSEIDALINRLYKKKKEIVSRMDRCAVALNTLIKDKEVQEGCVVNFVEECKRMVIDFSDFYNNMYCKTSDDE